MKTEGFRPPPDNILLKPRKAVVVSSGDAHPLPSALQRAGAAVVEFRWDREPTAEDLSAFLAEARTADIVVLGVSPESLIAHLSADLAALASPILTTDPAVRMRLAAVGARAAVIPSGLPADEIIDLVRRALRGRAE